MCNNMRNCRSKQKERKSHAVVNCAHSLIQFNVNLHPNKDRYSLQFCYLLVATCANISSFSLCLSHRLISFIPKWTIFSSSPRVVFRFWVHRLNSFALIRVVSAIQSNPHLRFSLRANEHTILLCVVSVSLRRYPITHLSIIHSS